MQHIPYFDAHCDTLSRCIEQGWDLWENPGQLDLKRLSAYDPVGQVFAIFLDSEKVPPQARWDQVKAQADLFQAARAAHPDIMGRCALSLEGAELVNCDAARLEELKGWGLRWVNLTWNHPNALSGSCATGEGLTDAGRAFVRSCWELGLAIDVSHLSDRGFWDLMDMLDGPVLASHSDSRALCPHRRNLTDDMARALIEANGYIGINFYTEFLGENAAAETAADHLEHFLSLGGEDCVGLGSDFDGADVPADLSGLEDIPNLWAVLERRGYGRELLRQIFYGNLARFIESPEKQTEDTKRGEGRCAR